MIPKQRQRDKKPTLHTLSTMIFDQQNIVEHRLNTNQTDQNTLEPRWISTDQSTDPTVVGMGMILSR
jgi:hypothetical protein